MPDEPEDLRAKYEEARFVVEGIKAYLAPWRNDKRLKVMGEILLGEIARLEKEARRPR